MCAFRYYPEGGWGWCVLACASLARALAHGAQLSFAFPLAWRVARRFLRAPPPPDGPLLGEAEGGDGDSSSSPQVDQGQESFQLGECVITRFSGQA